MRKISTVFWTRSEIHREYFLPGNPAGHYWNRSLFLSYSFDPNHFIAHCFNNAFVYYIFLVPDEFQFVELTSAAGGDLKLEEASLDREHFLGCFPHRGAEKLAVSLEDIDQHGLALKIKIIIPGDFGI